MSRIISPDIQRIGQFEIGSGRVLEGKIHTHHRLSDSQLPVYEPIA